MKPSNLVKVVAAALALALVRPASAAGVATLPGATAEPVAPSKPGAEPPPRPPPRAILPEHVFRAADELEVPLRKAESAGDVDAVVEEVGRQLESVAAAFDGLRSGLEPEHLKDISAREIDRLRQSLARGDLLLDAGQAALEKRSELVAGATRELRDRHESWRLTAEAARRDGAPAAVLRRAAQVEERLRAASDRLQEQLDKILTLQGKVSDLRAELARGAAAVDQAEAALERQLFEVESVPLWRALTRPDRAEALGGQLRQALRETGRDVARFLEEEQGRLVIHLAVVLALGLGLLALRRPVAAMGVEDPALASADRVLARPWSAALLLSLLLASSLYPPLPPTLRDLFFLAFLAPLLRLLPGLLPAQLRRPLFALALLFALDKVASVAPPRTMLARLATLVVTGAALAGLLGGLRPGGWLRFLGNGRLGLATRLATLAALACLAVAAVSNVVGNATLAARLTSATLTSATLGAVLIGVQAVVEGALAALLHVPAIRRRPMVTRHGALLQRRATTLLRGVAVLAWAWRTAVEFGVASSLGEAGAALLGLRLQVGGLDVSLGNVAAFALTLGLSLALARGVRFVLDEGIFTEVALPRGIPAAISTTVQYALVVLGFSWAVLASGMEVSRFSFLVGALGVGIGFGLQNVVNNVVSGLILLYERPVQAGDIVEVGAVAGEVTRIGVRSSTVRTFAGAEVIVPNASLISTEVTNWTLSDRRRRIELAVGVAYGTPPQQVIELLLGAVQGRAGVVEAPPPVALLLRFGESSIDFVLRFWTAELDGWQLLASDVMIEVHARLGRAGIAIPFPQRDLHIRSFSPEAARTLAAGAGRPAGGDQGAGA